MLRGRNLIEVVERAVAGGVTCVQLREKHLPTADFLALANKLIELLAPRGIPLVINDRVDVALACGAQGVHLGQTDLPVAEARAMLPRDVFIGWSVESMDDVSRSHTLAVDYLGVSPVFATPTKVDTAAPWGLDGMRAARAGTSLPLVAIGGINAGNARAVLEAGADGIAVVSAVIAADDPGLAAAHLRTCFQDPISPSPSND